jgi:hypothetical protein
VFLQAVVPPEAVVPDRELRLQELPDAGEAGGHQLKPLGLRWEPARLPLDDHEPDVVPDLLGSPRRRGGVEVPAKERDVVVNALACHPWTPYEEIASFLGTFSDDSCSAVVVGCLLRALAPSPNLLAMV